MLSNWLTSCDQKVAEMDLYLSVKYHLFCEFLLMILSLVQMCLLNEAFFDLSNQKWL